MHPTKRTPLPRTALSLLAVLWLSAVLGSGCTSKSEEPDLQTRRYQKLAADLHLAATGDPIDASALKKATAAVRGPEPGLTAWVDDLLGQDLNPRFLRDLVVYASTPIKGRHPLHYNYVLRQKRVDGTTVHYLRRPCAPSEAVSVTPWWEHGDDTILVCPEAYRPEVRTDDAGRTCGATMLDPAESDVCGCGPMLVYCVKDKAQLNDFKNDILQEVDYTVAHVVNNDLPIDEAFTMNASVHSEGSAYLYRRARVVSGEDPKTLFPMEGLNKNALRPRHEQMPGQHAGVLSSPMMLYASDALRGVMRNYYDALWCTGVSRASVETAQILALKKVDLRVGDGWKELAAMDVCTDCHAKLDYGMQYFWGWPSSTMGVDFNIANIRHGDGPFYGDTIKDHRGDGPLTPAGFARLVTGQPEFAACMSKKVLNHVFNGTASSADMNVVSEAFDQTRQIKPTLRAALLRYAKRVRQEIETGKPPPAVDAPALALTDTAHPTDEDSDTLAPGPQRPVSPALQKLLHKHCRDCHGKDDPIPLVGETLAERDIAWILDRVGTGAMPKGVDGIDEATRRDFVRESATVLFADQATRDASIAFYNRLLKAQPTHRYFSAVHQVQAAAGVDNGPRPNGTESAVDQSLQAFSPGMGLTQAMTALTACKDVAKKASANERDAVLSDCLERATAPSVITAGMP